MSTRLIGERVRRSEDRPLVSGKGRFLDDVEPPGCLHAAVVRAEYAHARLKAVDTSLALGEPGAVAIYTHADLGELDRPLPLGIPNPGLHHPKTQLPLVRDETHFVGEPIALVIATDRATAEDVAEGVVVEYEPLPVVASLDVAGRADALAHDDVPGNVAAELRVQVGDAAAAFDSAPHVISRRLWAERGAAMPLETRGVIADYQPRSGELTVWDSTQSPNTVRLGISGFFKLPEHKVDVIAPDVGGGFGVKIAYWYPEELLIPFASISLGRPVKWVEDRREHFIGSNHERGQVHDVRIACDDDGRVLALEDHFKQDTGAFVPYGVIVPLVTMARLPGPYKIPALDTSATVYYTNTVPVTPYRGAGQPEAVFVMERMIDAVAAELGLSKDEVRRRNFIQPEDFPYQPGSIDEDGEPATYDSGNLPAVLEKCLELIQVDQLERHREEAAKRGAKVGFGIGAYVEITGGELYEGARVQVEPSGRVFVTTGVGTQGQGHKTVLAQVAGEVLGVPFEQVEVVTGDTRQFRWATGTFASRIAVISGNAVANAAQKVRDKALTLAAEVLEASKADLTMEDGRVHVKGSPEPSVSLPHLAVLANPLRVAYTEEAQAASQFADRPIATMELLEEPGLEASGYFAPEKPAYANGCHAALVEVDPATFQIRILRYAAVHDCGKVINPTLVEGQMCGGIAQGIGGAFYEKLHYDQDGQLLNASFMDYLIPYTTEVPVVELGHVETPSPLNPLGLKGCGEAGVIPPSAVLAGAIEDALGIQIDESILSPNRLFELTRGDALIIEGTHTLEGISPEVVFDALSDPAVLARTLPGCRELIDRGEGVYEVSIYAGVGSVRGTYSGRVSIGERRRPELYEATLEASGGPGSVTASLHAELSNGGSGTDVSYRMDARMRGRIAGVGQRVVSGVSRKNASTFFSALELELRSAGDGAQQKEPAAASGPPREPRPARDAAAEPTGAEPTPAGEPRVYPGSAPTPMDLGSFLKGFLAGLALAILVRRRRR